MYQLTQDNVYGERLVKMLANVDLKMRRVILGDLGAIGYLAASDAIAQAQVEPSFKLMALKGILEHQLRLVGETPELSPGAIRVINLMDSLL